MQLTRRATRRTLLRRFAFGASDTRPGRLKADVLRPGMVYRGARVYGHTTLRPCMT